MKLERLKEIVGELVTKPRHEKVRGHLLSLLTDGLGAASTNVDFERQVPEVRGRIDALLGRTVFEIKSDLARERADAEAQLARYLAQRERETGQRYVGVATDGAEFLVYMLRGDRIEQIGSFRPRVEEPRGVLGWLESVVVVNDALPPDVDAVRRELGRESIHYRRAFSELEELWERLKDHPEAQLKRDLWNRLLNVAYGGNIEAPKLFLQHTYLTIVAKAIATVALNELLPPDGAALLDGKAFRDAGIVGAVERDFFDWVLLDGQGGDLVMNIARHVNRFRLLTIETDVLKGLYESLIDPAQRHDLGEYYTPDWLAHRICEAAIVQPLEERVIDPACGSGTFLFHAVRRLLAAAEMAALTPADAVALACEKVAGIDVHPVGVIFARATFLLALAPRLANGRPTSLAVPVYLGDSLQWNARELMGTRELEIVVPAAGESSDKLPDDPETGRVILRFPEAIASDPPLFDATLDRMLDLAARDRPEREIEPWLQAREVSPDAARMLMESCAAIRSLQKSRRDHIWGYVARNLSRPIWLSSEGQKADVVVGNPPWLDYRRMSIAVQQRFRSEMRAAGLWDHTAHGAAFDLSAYFFASSVILYMRRSGRIAFVMPYAAMSRGAYRAFRTGSFKIGGNGEAQVRFTAAWAFPADVQPLFPVPSCVLFAERATAPQPLPSSIQVYSGNLRRRDAHPSEADADLAVRTEPWSSVASRPVGSPYRDRFRAGAKLDPRRLVLVEKVPGGRLGTNPWAPVVRGRTGNLDKAPWKHIQPPQGPVEADFLRQVFLGESIGPFRTFEPVLAVIPWDEAKSALMTADTAGSRGYVDLCRWLEGIEDLWKKHGKGTRNFIEKIDFYRQLSSQFPIAPLRVAYTAAGSNPAAAVIRQPGIIDYKLYWMATRTEDESLYLAAILNSETTRARAEHWQSEGQWGKRDFDKAMLNLSIPTFDPEAELHRQLAAAGSRAEKLAAAVPLKESEHFTRARRRIRETLREAGIADEMDRLVSELLR
jgi:hypothetical protein